MIGFPPGLNDPAASCCALLLLRFAPSCRREQRAERMTEPSGSGRVEADALENQTGSFRHNRKHLRNNKTKQMTRLGRSQPQETSSCYKN